MEAIALRNLKQKGYQIVSGQRYQVKSIDNGYFQGRQVLVAVLEIKKGDNVTLVPFPKEWLDFNFGKSSMSKDR